MKKMFNGLQQNGDPSGFSEPKLLQAPKRPRLSGRVTRPERSSTPVRAASVKVQRPPAATSLRGIEVKVNVTADDAVEGTEAFKNRIAEITSFRVVARVRPFIAEELAKMQGQERRSIVEMLGDTTILLDPKDDWAPKAQFEFDASFWSIPPSHNLVHTFHDTRRKDYARQKDVYAYVAKDLVPHVFNGFNSCVLSYGQTGSGKTYTMMGIYDPSASCGGDGEEGIIPRVSNDLFILLAQHQAKEMEKPQAERIKYRVEVSFVEIYMERVRDLLDPALRHTRGNEKLQDARIRQDPYSGPFVEGVTKYQVENWAQCCTLLERGSQHRTTCATAVHNQSSRSHAIFQLILVQEQVVPPKDRFSRPTISTKAGRINLVDLAGSERGGFQDYVKESAAINTSLLALRRVIDNLTERQNMLMEQAKAEITGAYYQERPLPQVPFRDSVLTWLLSDSIGGNARTTMVATISPLVKNYGDTLATLQWSSKTRNLVTLVKMNDQSLIQGGMTNRAGELDNAVRIQRHNLDSLRETLRYKQQRAEKLEKEARSLRESHGRHKGQLEKLRRDRAALIIQRVFHRYMLAKKLAVYQDNFNKTCAALAKGDTAKFQQALKEMQAEEEAAKQRLRAAKGEMHAMTTHLSAIERARESFEIRRDAAQQGYDSLCKEIGADDICRRHTEKVAREVDAARADLEAAQGVVAARKQRVVDAQAKIEASKAPDWMEGIKRDAAVLAALREQRDALRKKHDDLAAQLQRTRAKHRKVVKGK